MKNLKNILFLLVFIAGINRIQAQQEEVLYLKYEPNHLRIYSAGWEQDYHPLLSSQRTKRKFFLYNCFDTFRLSLSYVITGENEHEIQIVPYTVISSNPNFKTIEQLEAYLQATYGVNYKLKRGKVTSYKTYIVEQIPNTDNAYIIPVKKLWTLSGRK